MPLNDAPHPNHPPRRSPPWPYNPAPLGDEEPPQPPLDPKDARYFYVTFAAIVVFVAFWFFAPWLFGRG